MASQELQGVIELLRSAPPIPRDASPIQMRAAMESMTGMMPLPEDVRYQPVDAGGVAAEWTVAPGARDDCVIVYLHGGGYVIGSIKTHRQLTADLSRAAGARVLSVDYRLAPEDPHPAAVEDASAAYGFVLAQGVDPRRAAIAGDSAGGGLTAATLLALRDREVALPAAGVCISPWLDLTLSGESIASKAEEDPLVPQEGLQTMADAYVGGADPRSPLISPLFAELAGLPPLLVQVGTAEILLDDSTRFAERARAAGVDVNLEVWDDMIHVWHAFAAVLPEGRQAIERIGEFLNQRWG